MFKVIIQMDEEKIKKENKFDLQKIYSNIDNLFEADNLKLSLTNNTREYTGSNPKYDCANIGFILTELEETKWFISNCLKCLWLTKTNTGWDTEDVLVQMKG